jgi:hypothetical protein
VAVILAVITEKSGGDGWESNPPRTPQQRPANGFEDRGSAVRLCPLPTVEVRREQSQSVLVRSRLPSSAGLAVFLAVRVQNQVPLSKITSQPGTNPRQRGYADYAAAARAGQGLQTTTIRSLGRTFSKG